MLDTGVQVVSMVEDTKYERDGTRTPYIRVEFVVGKLGPFTERFPKDGFNRFVLEDKLNTFAREVATQ